MVVIRVILPTYVLHVALAITHVRFMYACVLASLMATHTVHVWMFAAPAVASLVETILHA
jgi:hypothetical protein